MQSDRLEQSENSAQASPNPETHESNQSLWMLVISPTIWSVHFLASYFTAAIWCAKVAGRDSSLMTVRVAIAIYTAIALAGIGFTGWIGYTRQTFGTGRTRHHMDTPEDRHRFLGYATLLLSGLSAVATIYVAMAAIYMETCH